MGSNPLKTRHFSPQFFSPTGDLENMLSDGIVTFNKTKNILQEFQKVISVPVWLIGIDIKIN